MEETILEEKNKKNLLIKKFINGIKYYYSNVNINVNQIYDSYKEIPGFFHLSMEILTSVIYLTDAFSNRKIKNIEEVLEDNEKINNILSNFSIDENDEIKYNKLITSLIRYYYIVVKYLKSQKSQKSQKSEDLEELEELEESEDLEELEESQ